VVSSGCPCRRSIFAAFALAAAGVVPISAPASGQEPVPQAAPSSPVRVAGVVTDRETGRELLGVSVILESTDPERPLRWSTVTSASGRFRSPPFPEGIYSIRATALGFSVLEQDITLMGASELAVRIELVPDALELDPILVTSLRRTRMETSGFAQRRNLGLGHFFTREDIEQRGPLYVSDLLRSVPGARITTVRGRGGSEVRLRRGCIPDLLVNGILVRNPGPIDDFLSVGDLEALEVHHGGAGSLTLSGNNCGAIMAWTREGGGEGGDIPRLDRLVVALTIVTFGLLFTR
jgi:hypothetical protein